MLKTIVLLAFLFNAGAVGADIVFVANLEGNWDLFSADDSGHNTVQLTQTPYDEKDPCWSRDKKHVIYATSDGHLNILEVATKHSKKIVEPEKAARKINPAISPDGKELAYIQLRPAEEGDDTDLMVFNLESMAKRRVLNQYALQMWPSWSPDGSRLAYTSIHCSADCGRMIQELWLADPKGGWARQLLMTHSFCQQPAWSPDGRKIAFSSDMSGNFDIWVLDIEAWKLQQITTDINLDIKPAWSPDGKKLAFVSTRSGIMEIWIQDLESGNLKRFRPFGDKDVACKDVAW